VRTALANAGREIPFEETTLSVKGGKLVGV